MVASDVRSPGPASILLRQAATPGVRMWGEEIIMHFSKTAVGLFAFGALSLGVGGTAWGSGPADTQRSGTDTFVDVIPCNENLGDYTITVTFNGIEHSSENNNGQHFTFTQTGTFVATPLDGSGETFTGRFTVWGGGNTNPNVSNFTFTFSARGTGSEGTTFRANDNAHITTEGPGDPFDPATATRVAFENTRCH
ncbi:MAG: hypothetical protein ABIS21_01360 [Acidimicrobiales bacterium]